MINGKLGIVGVLGVLALCAAGKPYAQATGSETKHRTPTEATNDHPLNRAELEALIKEHRGSSLTVVTYGGASGAAQRNAFFIPFQEQFGITIIEDTDPRPAKIQAMVESNNVTWDVISLGGFGVWNLGRQGMLEELDFRVVDQRNLLEALKSPWGGGGGTNVWATVLAYSTNSFPDEESQPKSWAEFWDVNAVPGRRGYGDFLTGHLEIPLLAAGYAVEEITFPLTPEQEEIIFQMLDELAANLTVYWSSGSTCPELLMKGELDMCSAWNGRIYDAIKQGAPLKICWECGFVAGGNAFVIPKGSPNKELAELFIAWSGIPEIFANYTKYIPYSPGDKEAIRLLPNVVDQETLEQLPTSEPNLPYAVFADEGWEGANFDRLNERYQGVFQRRGKTPQ
jgi:putative spermidine/putrescine transport system substrate-binding protein